MAVAMWVSTVGRAISRRAAISGEVKPSWTSSSTSTSRAGQGVGSNEFPQPDRGAPRDRRETSPDGALGGRSRAGAAAERSCDPRAPIAPPPTAPGPGSAAGRPPATARLPRSRISIARAASPSLHARKASISRPNVAKIGTFAGAGRRWVARRARTRRTRGGSRGTGRDPEPTRSRRVGLARQLARPSGSPAIHASSVSAASRIERSSVDVSRLIAASSAPKASSKRPRSPSDKASVSSAWARFRNRGCSTMNRRASSATRPGVAAHHEPVGEQGARHVVPPHHLTERGRPTDHRLEQVDRFVEASGEPQVRRQQVARRALRLPIASMRPPRG